MTKRTTLLKQFNAKLDFAERDAKILKRIQEGESLTSIAHKFNMSIANVSLIKSKALKTATQNYKLTAIETAQILIERLEDRLIEVDESIKLYKDFVDDNGNPAPAPVPAPYLDLKRKIIMDIAKLTNVEKRLEHEFESNKNTSKTYIVNLGGGNSKDKKEETKDIVNKDLDIAKKVVEEVRQESSGSKEEWLANTKDYYISKKDENN